jgi:hypothetical protein
MRFSVCRNGHLEGQLPALYTHGDTNCEMARHAGELLATEVTPSHILPPTTGKNGVVSASDICDNDDRVKQALSAENGLRQGVESECRGSGSLCVLP